MDLKRTLSALLLLLASWPVIAAAPVVRVVGPDPVAGETATLLARHVAAIEVRRDDAPARLVVAVGARAFRAALDAQAAATEKTPVVGIALNRAAYRQVVKGRGQQTALFWEPDPVRQLQLAHMLLPGARRVGIVLGSPDEPLVAALRLEAARLHLEPVIGIIGVNDTLSRRLSAALADSDFLLGIDDPQVFAPDRAKTVLLTSYRHGKPVIGPSSAWVSAGSVATLVAGMPEMIDALAAWMPALLADGNLPPPRYVDHYTIVTNPQVARSLQLSLPSVQRLEAWLRAEGGMP